MFPAWRLRLREARAAWRDGRYDEAGAMLADERLREFLPAKQLAQQVAGKMLERAGNRFEIGDTAAGWQDLLFADRLGGEGDAVNQLRRDTSIGRCRRSADCWRPDSPHRRWHDCKSYVNGI